MKYIPLKIITFSVVFMGVIFMNACNPATGTKVAETPNDTQVMEGESVLLSLTDRLRSLAGVNVKGDGRGATVRVRSGGNSIIGDSEPLFVVDGQAVSGGLSEVIDMINVQDIKRIRVLKSATEVSFYGARGANGVIEIETN